MLDQEEVVDKFKQIRETWSSGILEGILCRRDGLFLASITAPRDAVAPEVMLSACIPALYADEAVYTSEAYARPSGADQSIPIDEDPSATPALLIVFSDREGLRNWRLCPYGVEDDGRVSWKDPADVTSPEVDSVMALIDKVYGLGDLRDEREDQLARLTSNAYRVVAHRRILEEGQ